MTANLSDKPILDKPNLIGEPADSLPSLDWKSVAVVGATGYTGHELIRLLLQHPRIKLKTAVSQSSAGKNLANVYPNMERFTELVCSSSSLESLADETDLIFLALPHGHAAERVTEGILEKCKVIDLGADFRLQTASQYEDWYGYKHPTPELLKESVYGLPELNRRKIAQARLVANPGCYATGSLLALAPMVSNQAIKLDSIIVDGKSGVSGAGRALTLGNHFDECNESIKAYKVGNHRHTPEIEQELEVRSNLKVNISFTPHLVPMNRGILITAYASLAKVMSLEEVKALYTSFYAGSYFIRLYNTESAEYPYPETRWVKGSNFCDIGVTIDVRTNRLIAICALDNLVKGAAGQAIQNMNLLFGWDETLGLKQMPIFPA